jgi:UDP-N-acetylmuramate--alanine ligase
MPETELDLTRPRRIHVVGVGGTGMSAIATALAAMGHRVTGSDIKSSASLERLRSLGVTAFVGHDVSNLADAEVVTTSAAIPANNLEVVEAERRGIPLLRRAETLAAITATRRTISIAGTHGKTTTSSMLTLVLTEAGLRPSFIIGGDINEVGGGAAWGEGAWLVVEADESDGTFLELHTELAVLTSVAADHLEYYGSMASLEAAFAEFLARARGRRIVCTDDATAARLGREAGALTYGTSSGADYQMIDITTERSSSRFTLVADGINLGEVRLAVPGRHNARNACGALVTGLTLGVPFDIASRALGRYGGVARRFEFRGERGGVTFVDDYAHIPDEVAAAVAAARDGGWRRIIAVFQPHRYSRTATLWQDFADAFVGADVVIITDVYAAGEAPRPGVSGRLIFDAVRGAHPERPVTFLRGRREVVDYLKTALQPGDLCLTLGAGDLTLLPDALLAESG